LLPHLTSLGLQTPQSPFAGSRQFWFGGQQAWPQRSSPGRHFGTQIRCELVPIRIVVQSSFSAQQVGPHGCSCTLQRFW
jgi:hypothetical protein